MLPDLRLALKEAKEGVGRATTPEQILVRQARQKSRLTQADFAERIGTPGAALKLLQLIVKHPELSAEVAVA